MKVTLSIASANVDGSGTQTRSFGNINRDYITLAEATPSPLVTQLPYNAAGTQYDSFAAWTSAVARGINSLSTRQYVTSYVLANVDIEEELV